MKPYDQLSTMIMRDGFALKTRTWDAAGTPHAHIIFVHGMGEHGGRYGSIAAFMNAQGIACHALDMRGHGHSPGRRGDISHYDLLLDDLEKYWQEISRETRAPLFFYAHSMGGQLLINLLTQRYLKVRGAIINAPWLALNFRPHPFKIFLSNVLRHVWPSFTLDSGTSAEMLAGDHEFLRSIPELHLTHKRMSARMFHALQTGAKIALTAAQKFTTPLLLMHGDADPITSVAASKEFFKNVASADKTLRIYSGLMHEIHNETSREIVLNDVTKWMQQRITSASQ